MTTGGQPVAAGRLSEKKLALLQQRLRGEQGNAAPNRIPRRPPADAAPLSFAQQRLWFLDQLVPGSPFYNILNAIRVQQTLNPTLLENSIREIVRRHEVLRARFLVRDGEPVQMFATDADVSLRVVDLRAEPTDRAEAEVARLANEEARTPFDLAAGPPLRTLLVQLGEAGSVLVVTMHHIVSDGWSMGILLRELNLLYEGFALGRPTSLPELPVQYADYAVWQRAEVAGELRERQLEYWRRRLEGMPTLELVTDRPRRPVQTFRGSYLPVQVDANAAHALRRLSRAEGVTLFMTMLAGFKALLHRYTGQLDLVVGSPIAGRNRTELEGLIGFFVNTLVLRTRLSGAMTFRELLHAVQATALEAYAHQDLPFEMLVEELQPERDLSRNPMFQVMFQLLTASASAPAQEQDEPAAPPPEVTVETAKFDLTITLTDTGGSIAGSIEFNTDLFDEATVDRMVGHYRTLLAAVAEAPDTPISAISLTDAGERGRVAAWNATSRDYPRDRCVHRLFADEVRRSPGAPAVTDGEWTVTYLELEEAANRLARVLRRRGAGGGDPVALLLPRSLDQVVATLAVLKAGGAYLPLDPSYPPARLTAMLADAGVRVVVTTAGLLADLLDGWAGERVLVDAEAADIDAEPSTDSPELGEDGGGERVAYVMYTSGSTGTPKGIAVPHRAIARLVRGTDYVALGPGDRIAHASNCSFDAATFEIWGALVNGGHVIVVPRETTLAYQELARFLEAERIDVLFVTTALFNQVAQHAPTAFRGVRDLLFGGEAVDPRSVHEVFEHGCPARLLHVYGPTESTTFASWFPVTELTPGAATIPIGRALANTTLYVLDDRLELSPVGVPGTLFIGGDGLAHGYVGQPALTAERFVPDPFAARPGSRLYATGDVVRLRSDGEIEFVGRVDDQVKVRGFRIELTEVKTVLESHPAVREAVVLLREDLPDDKRLVAYVLPEAARRPAGELRAFLRERLPDYMVPAAFVTLDELPLTPNGKIDRAAFPPPTDERGGDDGSFVGARTPNELLVAGIWAAVLGLERVGVHDNFFDLGGHSLLMAKVHNRLTEVVSHPVTMIDLFQYPTISTLARRLDSFGAVPAGEPSARPPRPDVEDRVARQRTAIANRAARERNRRTR